jgi:hypothetical protein
MSTIGKEPYCFMMKAWILRAKCSSETQKDRGTEERPMQLLRGRELVSLMEDFFRDIAVGKPSSRKLWKWK